MRVFLLRPLAMLSEDFDVTVVGNISAECRVPGAAIHCVPFARRPSPGSDLRALIALLRFLRAGGFDLVHSFTPKAGLLSMIAAYVVRVPVRIHTFTGQIWATRRGISRVVLRTSDRLLAACATHLLADSPSQRDFLIAQKITAPERIDVLGHGSVAGVDTGRFHADPAARKEKHSTLNFGDHDVVFLFLGRLTRDKGVLDLARAFAIVSAHRTDVRLVFAGPDEENLSPQIQAAGGHRCHILKMTEQPEDLLAASDVLCLPSYREGFGAVILEAAACGVPALASRIYGIVDAVDERRTGLLHEPGNIDDIAAGMERLARDADLRVSMGVAARKRAETDFSPVTMMEEWRAFYRRALGGGAASQ